MAPNMTVMHELLTNYFLAEGTKPYEESIVQEHVFASLSALCSLMGEHDWGDAFTGVYDPDHKTVPEILGILERPEGSPE